MKLIRTATELQPGNRKVCLAIGVFDGVHLGHQQIIRQTVADARQYNGLALVVTFDRHPNAVVAPDRVPPLIYSLPQKLRAIESLGADTLLLIRFDKAFSEQTGEAFIRGLVRDLGGLQSICVGADFTFGHKGVLFPVKRFLRRHRNFVKAAQGGSLLALRKVADDTRPPVSASDWLYAGMWYLPLQIERKWDKHLERRRLKAAAKTAPGK